MVEWIATKTVTEYHTFPIEAENYEQALAIAEDDFRCYCDSDRPYDTIVLVENVERR